MVYIYNVKHHAMKTISILLIDDDEDDREVFSSAVEMISGCSDCVTLDDAASALEKLENHGLTPDVIFLDLNMPKMDGRDFFLKIKANPELSHIPIVLFSTSSFLESVRSDILEGADFIAKPDSFTELKLILQDYLNNHFTQMRRTG